MLPKQYSALDEMIADLTAMMETERASDSLVHATEMFWFGEQVKALLTMDPFSDQYRAACQTLYRALSGRDSYDPHINERSPHIDVQRTVSTPIPYTYGDSITVADFYLSWGWILRNLAVRQGHRVLEYGAGEGQLALALARMGCDVSVIEIEPFCLDAIAAQAQSLGVTIHLQRGEFGDSFAGAKFDRIIFFEAFHHAFDHRAVLDRLRDHLSEDGFVLFAGEPIVKRGHYQGIPFPWGPRLDGLSIWSTHTHGWCELGFQEEYFTEMLWRAGWVVRAEPFPFSGRGHCYMAKPMRGAVAVGEPILIGLHDRSDAGWYGPEGTHRWTNGHAVCPVPAFARGGTVSIDMANYLDQPRSVTLRCGADSTQVTLASGQSLVADLALTGPGTTLEILSDASPEPGPKQRHQGVRAILRGLDKAAKFLGMPASSGVRMGFKLLLGSTQARLLGIAVKSIEFSGPRAVGPQSPE